jgi:hypothetical protein
MVVSLHKARSTQTSRRRLLENRSVGDAVPEHYGQWDPF